MALQKPWARPSTVAAPLVGILLAAAAIAATVHLQDRVASANRAQLRLADARLSLTEAQALPWNLSRLPKTLAHLQLVVAERSVRDALTQIQRDYPNAALGRAQRALTQDYAALAAIERFSSRGGNNSSAAGSALGAAEVRTLQAVLTALSSAGDAYARDARTAQRESLIGGGVAIVMLLLAFAFFQQRSVRSADRLRSALALAEDARRELQAALKKLGAAQEERLQLLGRTVEAAERERRRIAADLHDGPIQRLTAITLSIDLLVNRLTRGDQEVVPAAQQVRDQLAAEMTSLRRMMAELHPPVLDERGVAAAITEAAAELLPPTVEQSVSDRTGGVRFAPEVETITHRITREALVNIRKHAQARNVTIELAHVGDQLRLTVADDGVGFDAATHNPDGPHLGLVSMHERLESVGGQLHVTSEPGRGTRIEAVMPWRPLTLDQDAADARLAVA